MRVQLDMEGIDFRHLLHNLRTILVVRHGVVRLRHACFRIGPSALFPADEERHNA